MNYVFLLCRMYFLIIWKVCVFSSSYLYNYIFIYSSLYSWLWAFMNSVISISFHYSHPKIGDVIFLHVYLFTFKHIYKSNTWFISFKWYLLISSISKCFQWQVTKNLSNDCLIHKDICYFNNKKCRSRIVLVFQHCRTQVFLSFHFAILRM